MSERIKWKTHLIDFFFVTLGVFLAFGLNSWNEERKEKEKVRLFSDGLQEELQENRTALEATLEYHESLLQRLRKEPSKVNLVLNPADVNDVAWNLANGDIFKQHIRPEIFTALSKVYQSHKSLDEYAIDALRNINQMNVFGPYYQLATAGRKISNEDKNQFKLSVIKGWIPIFETWVGLEKRYLQHIEEALELMN